MSSLKETRWVPAPTHSKRWRRHLAATVLERASVLLARLATSMTSEPAPHAAEARVEFHADAGAPEGALYVDGKFIGWVHGVSRL